MDISFEWYLTLPENFYQYTLTTIYALLEDNTAYDPEKNIQSCLALVTA